MHFYAAGEDNPAGAPGDLDIGYDVVLFHGLGLREKFEIGDGMMLVPFEQARAFVDGSVLEDVAPTVIKYNDWRSVGAVVKPFRWKPQWRTGYEGEPELDRPPFFREAQSSWICLRCRTGCLSYVLWRFPTASAGPHAGFWVGHMVTEESTGAGRLFDRFPGSPELLIGNSPK